jgi:hypothetical protein
MKVGTGPVTIPSTGVIGTACTPFFELEIAGTEDRRMRDMRMSARRNFFNVLVGLKTLFKRF